MAPDRRRGLIQIFPNDIELALEEIRWGAERDCFGGVLIPAVSPGDPLVAPLFHTRYEPIEETGQMLGLAAAEVYNFDLDALAGLADRIGPTPEGLGQDDEVSIPNLVEN